MAQFKGQYEKWDDDRVKHTFVTLSEALGERIKSLAIHEPVHEETMQILCYNLLEAMRELKSRGFNPIIHHDFSAEAHH